MNNIPLHNLAKLLDFGAACLEQSKINVVNLRGAKRVFFPMIVATQSFAEGIFTLCKAKRTQICQSALRSLLDNLIKAKFLYCNPRKHCHVIYLDGLIEKEKQLKHALDFLKQNPANLTQINFGIKELTTSLKKILIQKKKANIRIDKHHGELILDTLGRARYVDKYNNRKNQKSNSLEWLYITIFRTLSSTTHINSLDFPNYFKIENEEIVVLLSGNPDDVGHILGLAEFLYKEMLIMFLKIFKNPSLKILNRDYPSHY